MVLDYMMVIIVSAVKFMVGVIYAIAAGFNFWERFLFPALGGILGIFIFTYFGDWIRQQLWKKRNKTQLKAWHKTLWDRFGLLGTALLTPPVLSPPIGTAIALAFGTEKEKILLYHGVSMVLWALLFAHIGAIDFVELFFRLFS